MKTLKNHTIIYDDDCPMCNLYTAAFVRTGMLDTEGREPYSNFVNDPSASFDHIRASNEIALINRKDQTIIYGLDSLLVIIGNSFPFFKPLFRLKPFKWLMKWLYFFVSYNRKVIIPGRKHEEKKECIPSYNIKYRIAYILFAWIITSLILNSYVHSLAPIVPDSSFYREFLVCGGQMIFQGTLLCMFHKSKLLEYLGHLMTISLGGALLLLLMKPVLLVLNSPLLLLLFFLMVAFLMLLENIRRLRLLGLPWFLTVGWVAYRVIVLFFIL